MGTFRIGLFGPVNNEKQSECSLAGEELRKLDELHGKVFCRFFFLNHISKHKDIAKSSWYSVIYNDMGKFYNGIFMCSTGTYRMFDIHQAVP